jgi:hypothetical protein
MLTLNFGLGTAGKVRIESAPLSSAQRTLLAQIYNSYLTNPNGFMEESDQIDTDSIKDILGVPKAQEVAPAGTAVSDDIEPNDPRAATTRRIYSEVSQ